MDPQDLEAIAAFLSIPMLAAAILGLLWQIKNTKPYP